MIDMTLETARIKEKILELKAAEKFPKCLYRLYVSWDFLQRLDQHGIDVGWWVEDHDFHRPLQRFEGLTIAVVERFEGWRIDKVVCYLNESLRAEPNYPIDCCVNSPRALGYEWKHRRLWG